VEALVYVVLLGILRVIWGVDVVMVDMDMEVGFDVVDVVVFDDEG